MQAKNIFCYKKNFAAKITSVLDRNLSLTDGILFIKIKKVEKCLEDA